VMNNYVDDMGNKSYLSSEMMWNKIKTWFSKTLRNKILIKFCFKKINRF
jgi:hypothetical protein